jgi:hypothetical protein
MKRFLICLLLAILSLPSFTQNQTREEKKKARLEHKAQLAAERERQARMVDSLETLFLEQQRQEQMEAKRKEKATALIVKTPFEDRQSIMNFLMDRMLKNGLVPALIDKDYFIIKTEPKQVYSATYVTNYTIYLEHGKVCIRAASTAHGSFSVGSGMFRSNTNMVVPVEYGGVKGSLSYEAWKEMEYYLLSIPNIEETIYEKQ